jgi:hypothetical protein
MERPSHDPVRLSARARASLARGLDALDSHTEAPLRVRGHASGHGNEVFDLQEEFELGPRGRRFLLSVSPTARDAMLLTVAAGPGAIR